VVSEQGRLLAEQLPAGHRWSYREQCATSLLHQGAEAAAAVVLDAVAPGGILIADGSAATPLVWHLGAVRSRPRYEAGPQQVTEVLLDAAQDAAYDAVFITAPDLLWEADGVRDDPAGRDSAFEHYRMLFPQALVIRGDDRLEQAQAVVSGLLRTGSGAP
jgi:nicotinamide riboside kinase